MGRPRADTPVPLTVGNSSSAIEHARLRCQPRGSTDTSTPDTWVPRIITACIVYSISAPPPGDRVVRTRGYGPSALDSRHPRQGRTTHLREVRPTGVLWISAAAEQGGDPQVK